MQDVNALLDACKIASGATSDNQLATALGVGRSAISNYRHGRALPDTVVCATIAGLSGVPLARVLGIVGEARAISREEKAVWRKLAASAALLLVGVLGAHPAPAQAATGGFEAGPNCALCEMFSGLRYLGGCLKTWLAHVLRRRKPSPDNVEVFAWI